MAYFFIKHTPYFYETEHKTLYTIHYAILYHYLYTFSATVFYHSIDKGYTEYPTYSMFSLLTNWQKYVIFDGLLVVLTPTVKDFANNSSTYLHIVVLCFYYPIHKCKKRVL